MDASPSRANSAGMFLAFLAIATLAMWVRLHDLTGDGLWMDELWSASFVQLGLRDLLVAVVRLDVHPPLYYLQLTAWGNAIGDTDWALRANSVLWSMLGMAGLGFGIWRIGDMRSSLLTSLFMAVAAGDVYYGHELRMYAMMSALTVLCWLLCDFYVEQRSGKCALGLVLASGLLATSHSASMVPVSGVMLYLLLRLGWQESFRIGPLVIFLSLPLLTFPWVVNSAMREVSHIGALNWTTAADTISDWLFGYGGGALKPNQWLGASIVSLAVVVAITVKQGPNARAARDCIVAFVVWPVFFIALISIAVRPVWISRLLEFCVPFAALALATALLRAWDAAQLLPRAGLVACGLALWGTMVANASQQGALGQKMEFREATSFLIDRVAPGDVIYVPDFRWFWGIARYYNGTNWGNPLTTQDPVHISASTAWDRVYAWLGPIWLERLHLVPTTREIVARQTTLVIGASPSATVAAASHVWLVGPNLVVSSDAAACADAAVTLYRFRGIKIFDLVCPVK